MRPLLTVTLALAILGGLQFYMKLRERFGPPPPVRLEMPAEGVFSLELTLTFDTGPDPFALDPHAAPTLIVRFRGQDLLWQTAPVAAGQTVRIGPLQQIMAGNNAFYVKAIPAEDDITLPRAARVQVLRDGQPVAEQLLWSDRGRPVEGEVRFATHNP